MIIKAVRRGNGGKLADYLLKEHKGDRDGAELLEIRGVADESNLNVALRSLECEAEHTRCKSPLYHVSFRPDEGEHLTAAQWQACIDKLEHRLGLEGQPRAIVKHHHQEEQHVHVVWSLIDREQGKAVHLAFDKERCTEVAREFEREHGLRRLAPAHHRTREPLSRGESGRARRGQDPEQIRAVIRQAWEHSDDGRSFTASLKERGFVLAQGDRRDFVAVDERGDPHSIGKRTTGATAAEVRARLADLDHDHLPSVEAAREQQQERAREIERESQERERKRQPEAEDGVSLKVRERERSHPKERAAPEQIRLSAAERIGQAPPLERPADTIGTVTHGADRAVTAVGTAVLEKGLQVMEGILGVVGGTSPQKPNEQSEEAKAEAEEKLDLRRLMEDEEYQRAYQQKQLAEARRRREERDQERERRRERER